MRSRLITLVATYRRCSDDTVLPNIFLAACTCNFNRFGSLGRSMTAVPLLVRSFTADNLFAIISRSRLLIRVSATAHIKYKMMTNSRKSKKTFHLIQKRICRSPKTNMFSLILRYYVISLIKYLLLLICERGSQA